MESWAADLEHRGYGWKSRAPALLQSVRTTDQRISRQIVRVFDLAS